MGLRDLLVALPIFASLPFILWRPYIGALVWVWIATMNPHRLAYGFARHFEWAFIVGITLLIGLAFSRERKRIPWNAVTVTLLLFLAWMGVTTLTALEPHAAARQYNLVFKIIFMTYIIMMVMQEERRLVLLVGTIVFSLGFYGVKGGLFTIATGGHNRVLGPPGSFIAGNNEIAYAMVISLPLMFYLYQRFEQKWVRQGMIGVMVLTTFAIFGTYSRTAMIAGAAMAAFLFLKGRQRVMVLVGAAILIPLLLHFMPERWEARMGTISSAEEDRSFMGRVNAWHFAVNLAGDHPIVGGGFKCFTRQRFLEYAPNPLDFHDAHSIVFEVLGEQGYPGLILFAALAWFTWRSATRVGRLTKGREDLKWAWDLARMTQASLVAYYVGGLAIGLSYFDVYYDLIAIVVATRAVVERTLRQEAVERARAEVEAEVQEARAAAEAHHRGMAGGPLGI